MFFIQIAVFSLIFPENSKLGRLCYKRAKFGALEPILFFYKLACVPSSHELYFRLIHKFLKVTFSSKSLKITRSQIWQKNTENFQISKNRNLVLMLAAFEWQKFPLQWFLEGPFSLLTVFLNLNSYSLINIYFKYLSNELS